MATIGDYLISIGFDTKAVTKGLKDLGTMMVKGVKTIIEGATKAATALGDSISKLPHRPVSLLAQSVNGLKGAFSSLLPYVAGYTIGSFFKSIHDNANELDKLSERTGANIQELQNWQGVMKEAGGDIKAVTSMAGKLQDPSQIGYLRALGVNTNSVTDAMTSLSDIMHRSSKFTRKEIGSQLGIDEDTVELLGKGRKELQRLYKAQQKNGKLTKESIQQTKNVDTAISKAKLALTGAANILYTQVIPYVANFAQNVSQMVQTLLQSEHGCAILAAGLGLITVALMGIGGALKMACLGLLLLLLEDIYVWLQGGDAAFGEFYDTVAKFFKDASQWVKDSIRGWEELFQSLKNLGTGIKQWWEGLIDGIVKFFTDKFSVITGTFESIRKGIGSIFGTGGSASVKIPNASTVNNANRNIEQHNNVTVHVAGTSATAQEIGDGVTQGLNDANRISNQAASGNAS